MSNLRVLFASTIFAISIYSNLIVWNHADFFILYFLPFNEKMFLFCSVMGLLKTVIRGELFWTTPVAYLLTFYIRQTFNKHFEGIRSIEFIFLVLSGIFFDRLAAFAFQHKCLHFPLYTTDVYFMLGVITISVLLPLHKKTPSMTV